MYVSNIVLSILAEIGYVELWFFTRVVYGGSEIVVSKCGLKQSYVLWSLVFLIQINDFPCRMWYGRYDQLLEHPRINLVKIMAN